jgi:putative transposase
MPRPPRPRVPGGIYHVTTRGVRKGAIYRDEHDRNAFLDLLAAAAASRAWQCLAYCLMTTHYHVLIRTPRSNVSSGMHLLNGRFARRFNLRHDFTGHLFERRFAADLLEDESHVFEAMRYIDLNPVRAGVCESPADWPWSGYRAAVGLAERPPFLAVGWALHHFGGDGDGRLAYQAFVREALEQRVEPPA